jgi:hypothetical protein
MSKNNGVDTSGEAMRESIQSVIDVDEFNSQCDLERQDAAHIEAHRRVVFDAILGAQHD